MKRQDLSIALLLCLTSHSLLAGHTLGHDVAFYIQNKCRFPIWPAAAQNDGNPVIAEGGFYLGVGEIHKVIAPWSWSGRIWARTGCTFGSKNLQIACETGDCDGRLACNGLSGTPPATLVQISLQGEKQLPNIYDVSVVDGYNLPVSVISKQHTPKCTIGGCWKDLKVTCPRELQVVNKDGVVVACKSGCLAYNLDQFCCRNEYGTPQKCKPTLYSKLFKEACPYYYSYAFDSPAPVVSCDAREYVIAFCPSGWGTANYTSI
ncbi:hypothetical protein ACFE04_009986 [Oxalis oulophora]